MAMLLPVNSRTLAGPSGLRGTTLTLRVIASVVLEPVLQQELCALAGQPLGQQSSSAARSAAIWCGDGAFTRVLRFGSALLLIAALS